MADLSSLSLSDLAAALKERCSSPSDLQFIVSKLDTMIGTNCTDMGMIARDAAAIREEGKDTRAAIFNFQPRSPPFLKWGMNWQYN